jgi:hypothetical protein
MGEEIHHPVERAGIENQTTLVSNQDKSGLQRL